MPRPPQRARAILVRRPARQPKNGDRNNKDRSADARGGRAEQEQRRVRCAPSPDRALRSHPQKLLRAARALFAERGYDATPIEEILAQTGLSRGALYHHFAHKRDLLDAIYTDPVVRRIALIDAPAVLGWRRWREIDAQYGFGLLLAGLHSAARRGRISTNHLVERGHLLLASLMESALLVGASAEPAATRAAVGRIVSEQIWGLAGEVPLQTPSDPADLRE